MSTLTRDPLAPPPLRRPGGRWDWPDPASVAPPPVAAPRRVAAASAPLWPSEPPRTQWPPLPEGVQAPVVPTVDDDHLPAALPSALAFDDHPAPRPSRAAIEAAASFEPPPAAAPRLFDPSPSRLAYRLHRLWLTPFVRHFLRLGLPALIAMLAIGGWLASDENRAALFQRVDAAVAAVQNQPVFQVNGIEVTSASPEVAAAVREALDLRFPVSSFALDLPSLRERARAFDAVQDAWLQVRAGGILEVRLQERAPVMVWRHAEGLDLVDASGHRVARLAERAARADLPLIAGEGAPEAIAEAWLLFAAALPLQPRLRGLVRVGQRRWDMVLDRDQRILLPEQGALGALERVLALDAAQQLLSRDVQVVDLRNPARPTIRLTEGALAEVNRNRPTQSGARSR